MCWLVGVAVSLFWLGQVPEAMGEAAVPPRSTPTCLVQVGKSSPRPCGYIHHSDACCIEPLATRPVASQQRHLAEGGDAPPHSNVTFTDTFGDAMYLVSHDESCGPAHECWELSLAPLGRLETRGADDGERADLAVVLVSFLAGPKPYNVSLTTVTIPRVSATQGQASQGHGPADCRLLRGSTPVLDIAGADATLRLVPPQDAASPEGGSHGPDGGLEGTSLPPVCVTLHSDQCSVDCRDFTVPKGCRRSKYYQSVHCVDKPFDSVLRIRNVTRFKPVVLDNTVVASAEGPNDTDLLYHCARLVLGGCVLATPTVVVRLSTADVVVDVALGAPWSLPAHAALFAALPVCLCLVILCVIHNFWSGLRLRRGLWKAQDSAERAIDLGVDRDALTKEGGGPCGAPRRVLLLYDRPSDATLKPLLGSVRALTNILVATGHVQVEDMYDDALLLEEGAVLRASTIVEDDTLAVVVLVTPGLTMRPSPCDLDPYNAFIASVGLGLSHSPARATHRVYTASLDPRYNPDFLLGIPVNAVYVMPYHLKDLLTALSGWSVDELCQKQLQAEERKLRKCLKEYTLLLPDSSVAAQV